MDGNDFAVGSINAIEPADRKGARTDRPKGQMPRVENHVLQCIPCLFIVFLGMMGLSPGI